MPMFIDQIIQLQIITDILYYTVLAKIFFIFIIFFFLNTLFHFYLHNQLQDTKDEATVRGATTRFISIDKVGSVKHQKKNDVIKTADSIQICDLEIQL